MSIFTIQDILQLIFNFCHITDKRNLIKTCKTCHKLSMLMPNAEKDFQEMINSTKYLDEIKFTSFDNPLYKYTIELVYDGYSHLIPNRYVVPQNRILHYYYNVYYRIAKNGNLDMLKLMLQIRNPPNLKDNIDWTVRGAARGGHKNILEWVMQKYKINYRATEYAAKGNHFELLKWLYDKGIKLTDTGNAYSVKTGNMEMIKWFFERNDYVDDGCLHYAVKNNNMDLVKWLYEKDNESLWALCDHAIAEGKLEILKWTLNRGFVMQSKSPYSCSMHGGHIEILEWLKENGYIKVSKQIKKERLYDRKKSKALSINAAWANNFQTLKWAYENTFPISPEVCKKTALNGNLEILEWYVENVGELTDDPSVDAVEGGHLEVLKWILKKGIKMSNKLCATAAWYGHFDLLKWLHENGCPWTSKTCVNAARMGHFSILKWAYEKGCPLSAQCCANTARYGHVEILKWLREKGCDWDCDLGTEAVQYNSVYIIEWFTRNGYKIHPIVYEELKRNKVWWKCLQDTYFFKESELVK